MWSYIQAFHYKVHSYQTFTASIFREKHTIMKWKKVWSHDLNATTTQKQKCSPDIRIYKFHRNAHSSKYNARSKVLAGAFLKINSSGMLCWSNGCYQEFKGSQCLQLQVIQCSQRRLHWKLACMKLLWSSAMLITYQQTQC